MGPRAREELVKILLRVAGAWGDSTVVLDRLLLQSKATAGEVRAARAWREGCHRAFIQVKRLYDTGCLIDPNRPEYHQRPS